MNKNLLLKSFIITSKSFLKAIGFLALFVGFGFGFIVLLQSHPYLWVLGLFLFGFISVMISAYQELRLRETLDRLYPDEDEEDD